jgi:hypothetical protein
MLVYDATLQIWKKKILFCIYYSAKFLDFMILLQIVQIICKLSIAGLKYHPFILITKSAHKFLSNTNR